MENREKRAKKSEENFGCCLLIVYAIGFSPFCYAWGRTKRRFNRAQSAQATEGAHYVFWPGAGDFPSVIGFAHLNERKTVG